MTLTRDFKALVQARIASDQKVPQRIASRRRGMPASPADLDIGEAILRDYINAKSASRS